MKKAILGSGLILSGFLLGRVEIGTARAQGDAVHYRVINENNGEKIEAELNKIVRENGTCKPVLGLSGDTYGKSKVILECRGG